MEEGFNEGAEGQEGEEEEEFENDDVLVDVEKEHAPRAEAAQVPSTDMEEQVPVAPTAPPPDTDPK